MNQTSVYHPRSFSPTSLAVIVGLHGAAITAAMLAKMEVIGPNLGGPIVVRPIPVEKDPPPRPRATDPEPAPRAPYVPPQPLTPVDDPPLAAAVTDLPPVPDRSAPLIETPPPLPPPDPQPAVRSASAKGDVRTLFSAEDYPDSARQREQTGTVQARLEIAPSGKVTGCSILRSSGSSALDSATCRVLKSRARFTPARDSNGQPVGDTYVTPRIVWKIEGEG